MDSTKNSYFQMDAKNSMKMQKNIHKKIESMAKKFSRKPELSQNLSFRFKLFYSLAKTNHILKLMEPHQAQWINKSSNMIFLYSDFVSGLMFIGGTYLTHRMLGRKKIYLFLTIPVNAVFSSFLGPKITLHLAPETSRIDHTINSYFPREDLEQCKIFIEVVSSRIDRF